MIFIKNLDKNYDDTAVVENLHLHIKKGEFVFLQGDSGSGKSTLLKILYRDVENFQGAVFIDGKPIAEMKRFETRRIIRTIFQSFKLLERKTALENVALAKVIGKNEADIMKETLNQLNLVGLTGKEDRFPHQLSGGEQQRVAIARALLNRNIACRRANR